jgi:hypothetical protein
MKTRAKSNVLVEGVIHMSYTILSRNRGKQLALNNKIELSSTWMNVRSIEATWLEKADSYGCTMPQQSWECSMICTNGFPAGSSHYSVLSCCATAIIEIEDEIGVLEKAKSISGA